MKKGQTEMLGLIVIVVLAAIILTFTLAFFLSGGSKDTIKRNLSARSMGDSILQYTPECPNEPQKDMRFIIKNCDFDSPQTTCGKNCKDLVTTEIKNIVQSIQKTQPNQEYGVLIRKGQNNLELSSCTSTDRITDNSIDPVFTLTVTLCLKQKNNT